MFQREYRERTRTVGRGGLLLRAKGDMKEDEKESQHCVSCSDNVTN